MVHSSTVCVSSPLSSRVSILIASSVCIARLIISVVVYFKVWLLIFAVGSSFRPHLIVKSVVNCKHLWNLQISDVVSVQLKKSRVERREG